MWELTTHALNTGKLASVSQLPADALGLTVWGTSGSEAGAGVEDVREGEVVETTGTAEEPVEGVVARSDDTEFWNEATTYAGEEVTVSPLLILSGEKMTMLEEGQAVEVTGTEQEAFDLPQVEEGMQEDLDDDLFGDYDGWPCVEATEANTGVVAEG